jgi:peptidoglycan/LPS O-acetylase OafA/YrhL
VQGWKPLDNGVGEIRALDGLRAIAALSIVLFHALHQAKFQAAPVSHVLGNFFWYLPSGVHLFFVLSGFLLFLPFARAMLLGRPLPGTVQFYQRRALRILPAYLVALAVLAWLSTADYAVPLSGWAVLTHLLMIHDMFPAFNREFEGPFWTLAVEVQFYLLLPVLAAALAWMMRSSRSPRRLISGILLLVVLALSVRAVDIAITSSLPVNTNGGFARMFVLLTMGMQGKYLEVFMMGMLAAVVYIISVEFDGLSRALRWRLAWVVACMSLAVYIVAMLNVRFCGPMFAPGQHWGVGELVYPLVVGVGYATLLLAILWSQRVIRWPFETRPMRFVGHISYSLYLWHNPAILATIPFFAGIPIIGRVIGAFLVAYVSYQLIERPFLRRRRRDDTWSSARQRRLSGRSLTRTYGLFGGAGIASDPMTCARWSACRK